MRPRILLLGKFGQLGWEAQRTFSTIGDVIAMDYPEIDFTRAESVIEVVESINPKVIYNAVAYTAVDKAEKDEKTARLVNAITPGLLAAQAKKMKAVFIHISTDFVFDGRKGAAYTEEDDPKPINIYGKTKLDGELSIAGVGGAYLILRTSWLYSTRRPSFVTKILQWSRSQPILKVVDDQIGSPTWARSLAELSAQIIAKGGQDIYSWVKDRAGTYHAGGLGGASRYTWAQEILKFDPKKGEQLVKELIPTKSAEFPTEAERPENTELDCTKLQNTFELSFPGWQSALQMALE